MKKVYYIFCMMIVCILVGCSTGESSNSKEESVHQESEKIENKSMLDTTEKTQNVIEVPDTTTEVESENVEILMDIPDEELSLMQKILLNKEEFMGAGFQNKTEAFSKQKVELYIGFCEYDASNWFYVVDLDHNGKNEVCVVYGPYVLILRDVDGEIVGYNWSYRSFEKVYADGTFESSGGASLACFNGNARFTDTEFKREIITAIKWEGETEHYYKNGEPYTEESVEITKVEYDEIMSQYPREEATRYDFTIENILKYVE